MGQMSGQAGKKLLLPSDYLDRDEGLARIGAATRRFFVRRSYEPGEPIIRIGERLEGLFILVEGRARVSMFEDGASPVLLSLESPPSILGEVEIIEGLPAISQVEALDKAVCLLLPCEAFHRAGETDAGLLGLVVRSLAAKLSGTSRASACKNASVMARLCWFLLAPGADEVEIVGREDLASFLGTSPRHLRRELRSLEEAGAIASGPKSIRILRRDALEGLAGPLVRS